MDTFVQVRPDNLREQSPGNPHADWCGKGEREAPPYPNSAYLDLAIVPYDL
jgi:hypothetical protein